MRSRLLQAVGIGIIVLATGCATGAGFAADLPQPRTLPTFDPAAAHESRFPDDHLIIVFHPPDAMITARETAPRWEKRLDASVARLATPVVSWALLLGLMMVF